MTSGDKGGRGVKNWDFYGDILFEWPLRFVDFGISDATIRRKS